MYKRTIVIGLAFLGSTFASAGNVPAGSKEAPPIVSVRVDRAGFHPRRVDLVLGRTVTLRFADKDVARRLLVPGLGLDLALEPGKPAEITLTPGKTGRYRATPDAAPGSQQLDPRLVIDVDEDPMLAISG